MDKPQIGELWIHKRTGDTFLIKELYNIDSNPFRHAYRNGLMVVKAIRLRDQYEWDEPLGMFTWEYKRLN